MIFWKTFMEQKFYELYEKFLLKRKKILFKNRVAFRHLDVKRTTSLIESLEEFVKVFIFIIFLFEKNLIIQQVIGKRYEITPLKLLKRFSVINRKIDEDRTFFCSELIAAIYKQMNLLDLEIASTQYWPGSFSEKETLYLNNGVKFSREYLIDFQI